MPNVFVFSASNGAALQHWRDTIEHGLEIEPIREFVDPATFALLRAAYPDGLCRLWAGRSGGPDEGFWNQMALGDLMLGYRNRSIISASYFVAKVRSRELGLLAWPDSHARPYDLVFFITPPEPLNRPVTDFPDHFGEIYQGLRRSAHSETILRDFGTFPAFVRALGGIGAEPFAPPPAPPAVIVQGNDDEQGVEHDARVRRAIELRAVTLVRDFYANELGFGEIEDTGDTCSYDLRCARPGEEVRVEVKDTRGNGQTVILTSGEVDHAADPPCRVDLAVVTGIRIDRNGDQPVAIGGVIGRRIEGWRPDPAHLHPTQFRYRIPAE